MMTDPRTREQIRLSILRFLEANPSRFGLAAGLLVQMLRSEGWPEVTGEVVLAELLYLEDKGLIINTARQISPEITHWRINAAGRDFMAQAGQ